MTRLGLIWLAIIGVIALCEGCYAHTPTPPCSSNPYQPGCLPPIHDKPQPGVPSK